jgi:ABC-type Fe3+-hydroxamate transport system substrate-binding protein
VLLLGCRSTPQHEQAASGPAQRVVSRTVFADEVLWALGPTVHARVVGVSPMADDPRYSMVAGLWPSETPRLGRNPEQLLALAPDLVILASFSEVEYRAAIEGKVAVLELDDFDGFASYVANLERIGDALGVADEAARLRDEFTTRRATLEARRPPEDQRPSVIAWDHGYVPGSETSFDDAASTAGFRNLAAAHDLVGHQRIDAEQLIAWQPEWIVIGCGEQTCAEAITQLGEQPGFSRLAAVTSGHVIAIESPYLATTGAGQLELAARMQARLEEGA